MRRRTYLAAVSLGALGFAGCSDGSDGAASAGNDGTPTDVIETLEPTATATVTSAAGGTSASRTDATTGATTRTRAQTDTVGATAGNTAIDRDDGAVDGRTVVSLTGGDDPVTVTSDGISRGGLFGLTVAPITAAFSHEGESNFIVKLIPADGDLTGSVTLVNAIGPVAGAQVVGVAAAGPYTLDVTAAGEWELTVNYPTLLRSVMTDLAR